MPYPTRAGQRARLAALSALAALAGGLCWSYARFAVIDDAYTSFRYARNLAAGLGLVFNPGERVEGYTNFLWVILLAPVEALGLDIVAVSKLLGALFAIATVVACGLLPARRSERPWWSMLLAPALLAANPMFTMWAVHGLETVLFAFLITMAIRSDLRDDVAGAGPIGSGSRWAAARGLWYALATLTRPEGAALFLASFSFAAMAGRAAPRRWPWSAAKTYTLIVGPFLVARWFYYGDLVPNTFHAKVGFTAASIWRGLAYVWSFAFEGQALLLLALVPAVAAARRDLQLRRLLWMVAAYVGVVVLEGGDVFPAWRFIAPALPLTYFVVQEGAWKVVARAPAVWMRSAAGVVILLLAALHLNALAPSAYSESRGAEEFTGGLLLAGAALRDAFPADTRISANPIGAVAYVSGFHVYDHMGLTDRHIGRRATPGMGRGGAGHEKGDGWYLMEQRPDVVLLGNVIIRREPPDVFLNAAWPAYGTTEVEFAEHPARARFYVRDALALTDGRWLYFFRRADRPPLVRSAGVSVDQ